VTTARQFDTLFVEAYRDAAAAGSDMRLAAELLEKARAVAYGAATTLEGALVFAELIASAVQSDEGLCAILGKVRDAVLAGKLEAELANFRDLARSDMARGHAAWLEATGRALGELECDLAQRCANAEIGIEPRERQRVAAGVDLVRKARWRPSSAFFASLAGDARLSTRTRARLFAILAFIDGLVRSDIAAAHNHLRKAEALNAKDWSIAYMRGLLCVRSSEPSAKAEDAYKLSDALSGSLRAAPLLRLGDMRKDADDLVAAEELYRKACARALRVSSAYTSLIALFGHPTLFSTRRQEIDKMVHRATLVSNDAGETYDALRAAAEAMRCNGDFDSFKAWNNQAIEFDPSRIQAYLDRAYANVDLRMLDAAAEDFEHVTAIAPEDPEGWWGKANVAKERKDWATQRDCAVQAMRRAPDLSAAITSELENTADAVRDDQALARSIFDVLRRELGQTYEATYQNCVANLHYYHGEYDKAVEHYRNAIRAAPGKARFLANLAIGLSELDVQPQDYTEALDVAQRASELDPQNANYIELHRYLESQQEFVRRFGTAARNFKHDTTRVRVRASSPLLARLAENDDRQPWLKQRIAALCETIKKSQGFTLPPILFSPLPDDDKAPSFALEIWGQIVCSEHFDAVPQDAMQPIEVAIQSHLSEVFGHSQAREAAGRCGDRAKELVADPVRLNAITATGRALLSAGKPLDCAELLHGAQAVKNARPAIPDAFPPGGAIAVHHGAAEFDDDFASWTQAHLFERTGVLIPLVVPEQDPGLPSERALVSVDGAEIAGSVDATKEAVAEVLAEHADRLLDAIAINRHLVDLESIEPDLIKVVRALLPLPKLMPKLRLWLADGGTLVNLAGVLETLAVAEAAPSPLASARAGLGPHSTPRQNAN
jgi:tetratricopeptide (TPR) repeat protein